MKGFYFKVTGAALVAMFNLADLALPEDARILKAGASAGLGNDFWFMVESEKEGAEIKEGDSAECRTMPFTEAYFRAAASKRAGARVVEAFQALARALEDKKRRIE